MARTQNRMRNLGPVSMEWLKTIGIETREELETLGAVEAYLRICDVGFKPSLNLLWALQGAVLDVHWAQLPPEMKAALKSDLQRAKGEPADETAGHA